MKLILLLCGLLSLGVAAPISDDAQAKIVSYENDNDGLGNYRFSFKTSNGISRIETGQLVNIGKPNEHIEVNGEYAFTNTEGKYIIVRYAADENGYHILEITQQLPAVIAAAPPALVATLLG